MGDDYGMSGGETAFVVGIAALVVIGFVVVIGAVLVNTARGVGQWNRNNASPLTTVPEIVIAERQERHGGGHDSPVSTSHFVSFEVQGGERMELPVSGPEYGVLLEGGRGDLTHQGTRFKGFDRVPQDR